MKFPAPEPMKCFTADKAVRPDAIEGVEKVELSSKADNDVAGPIQKKFLPVHGQPPSLLGSIPSALKDAEPLVSASEGTLIASTSRSSALLLALMLVSLKGPYTDQIKNDIWCI